MKMGQLVKHALNDNARGIVLTEITDRNGKHFFVVDWFVNKEKKLVEAKRHSPEELVAL